MKKKKDTFPKWIEKALDLYAKQYWEKHKIELIKEHLKEYHKWWTENGKH